MYIVFVVYDIIFFNRINTNIQENETIKSKNNVSIFKKFNQEIERFKIDMSNIFAYFEVLKFVS
jgi:hypothetical protein